MKLNESLNIRINRKGSFSFAAILAFLTFSAPCLADSSGYAYALQGSSVNVTDETGFAVFQLKLDANAYYDEKENTKNFFTRRQDVQESTLGNEAGFTMSYNKSVDAGGIASLNLSLRRDGESVIGMKCGAMLRYATSF